MTAASTTSSITTPTTFRVGDVLLSPQRFTYGRKKEKKIRSRVYVNLATKKIRTLADVVTAMQKDWKGDEEVYRESVRDAHGVICARLAHIGRVDLVWALHAALVRTVFDRVEDVYRRRFSPPYRSLDPYRPLAHIEQPISFIRDHGESMVRMWNAQGYDNRLLGVVNEWIRSVDVAVSRSVPLSKQHTLYTIPEVVIDCCPNGYPYTEFIRTTIPPLDISLSV